VPGVTRGILETLEKIIILKKIILKSIFNKNNNFLANATSMNDMTKV